MIDLMTFLRSQQGETIWLLTTLGVLIGTLERPPEHPHDELKLRDVRIHALDREPESVEELSFLVREVVSWDEGTPDLFRA